MCIFAPCLVFFACVFSYFYVGSAAFRALFVMFCYDLLPKVSDGQISYLRLGSWVAPIEFYMVRPWVPIASPCVYLDI